jgi:DivIVA domain-containing protein
LGQEPEQPPTRAPTRTRVPDAEIADLRDVRFPSALRGYDRAKVDDFVGRVNRVIAELQITAAPESAIRHALKQVTEETQGILERAHETADGITAQARAEARDTREAAAQDAREVREAAAQDARETREAAQQNARDVRQATETHVAELEADARRILDERARLIGDLRALARGLSEFTEDAAAHHPTPMPAEPAPQQAEAPEPEAETEAEAEPEAEEEAE